MLLRRRWTLPRSNSGRPARFRLEHLLYFLFALGRRANLGRQLLPFYQHLDLVGIHYLAIQQRLGNADQCIAVVGEDLGRSLVAAIHQPADFLINLDGGVFAEVAVLGDLASQEDLLFFLAESD